MLLNILITQYNEDESVIKPLLDSIANQINVDFRHDLAVIIVGSGPYKLDSYFLSKYPYSIEYIRIEDNGVSNARNVALDYSSADYIMYCDADDRFYNMLGIYFILNEIRKEPFDLLASKFINQYVDSEGNLRMKNIDSEDSTFIHGKCYRRNFLLSNNIRWNESLRVHEDSYFNVLVKILAKKRRTCETPFYMWCNNPKSVTKKDPDFIFKTYKCFIDSLDAIITELLKRDLEVYAQCQMGHIVFVVYFLMNSEKWLRSKYKPETERRFKALYKKYGYLFEELPQEYKLESYKRSKETSYEYGEMYEKITFTDWLKSVLK